MGQFEGADYDAYQTGSNQLNLGGSVIFNDKIFGTVTYRAVMIANQIRTDTTKVTGNIFAKNHYNGQIITRDSTLATLKYVDDHAGTASNGVVKVGNDFQIDTTFDIQCNSIISNIGSDISIGHKDASNYLYIDNTFTNTPHLLRYESDLSSTYTSQDVVDSAFVKKAIMSLAPVYNPTHLYMDSVVLDSVEIRTCAYKKIVNSTDSTLHIIPQFLIAKYRPIASYNPEENCTLFFYLTNNITRDDYETATFGLTPLFYNKNQNYSFPYIMPTSLSTSGIPNSNSLYIRTGSSAIGGGKATMTIVLYYFKIKKG